jgi:hypothetical protein
MEMMKHKVLKKIAGTMALVLPNLLFAQLPGVGIGTQTPHPAAVLHLTAPNNNQGLLLPRLTTAQMEASPFKNSLDASAKGITVFDTDRNGIYTWDGGAWKGTGGFTLPYSDSLENGSNQSNMVRLLYKGNTGAAVGILALENRDPNNSFSPLFVSTNSNVQGAADFIVTNSNNTNDGIGVTFNGLGRAGSFRVNNQNNAQAALFALTNGNNASTAIMGENTGTGGAGLFIINNANSASNALVSATNGTGNAANFSVNNTASTVAALNATTNGIANSVAVRGQATNGGTGVAAFSNGNTFISPALYAEHTGTGDAAGVFKVSNAANPYNAVFGETIGNGITMFALQKGTGRAGQFQINNAANTEAAVRGFTDGLGRAGFFTINNAANGSAAIHTTTNGTGNAGFFEVDNAASTVAALNASTNGIAGSVAVRGIATNSGTGVAAYSNGNAFISPALYAEQSGTGDAAGVFKLTNTSNPYNAVFGETVGSGSTFFAWQKGTGRAGQFQISNTSNTEAALRGFTDGLGRAGFFTINNAANNADAIYTTTNANGGTAIGAANSGNGNAIAIWDGGLRLSTSIINSNGNISNRSAAYEITAGSTFTINFPLNNGETFFFYNNTAAAATVNGISIPANSGKTCIVLSNTLRGM